MKKLGPVSLTFAFLSILILSLLEPISSYYEARILIIVKQTSHNFSQIFAHSSSDFAFRPVYLFLSTIFYKIFSSFPNGDVFSLRLLSVTFYVLLLLLLISFYEKDFLLGGGIIKEAIRPSQL